MSLLKLFLLFVKIGAILLGGGYVILPILKSEFVEKHNLITEEELVNYFAISQSLPGLVATNIAIFVGHKLKRTRGAVLAVLGLTFAPFWTIILLASVLAKVVNADYMQGIFWGVAIGVLVLLINATREIWEKAIIDNFSFFLFFALFAILMLTPISPAIVVVLAAFLGILYKSLVRRGDA